MISTPNVYNSFNHDLSGMYPDHGCHGGTDRLAVGPV